MASGLVRAAIALGAVALPAISLEAAAAPPPLHIVRPVAVDLGGAFQQTFTPLSDAERERFDQGKSLLQRIWVVAPSADADSVGLGPLFNQRSCIACHPANGRGHPPERPDERLSSALVRLSVIRDGVAAPHPNYGWQFNEHGIPGVPGEGRISVSYTYRTVHPASGPPVELRQPHLSFRILNYGPMGPDVRTSLRVAPAIYGMSLLELVSDDTLLEYAASGHTGGESGDVNRDGIAGHANLLRDAHHGNRGVGRFGLKSNVGDLHTQIASAFSEDLGITTPRFPETNCTPAQIACRKAAPSSDSPEGTPAKHHNLPYYLMQIAPPERRHVDDPLTLNGERLFRSLGCAACHRESMATGDSPDFPALSHREFHPYSDLLLHDMGPGLADGRPDQGASGSDWRTAPLWGLGLAQAVDPRARYLHDGRARTIPEAILWHDGEARSARDGYRRLANDDRLALLRFLDSL